MIVRRIPMLATSVVALAALAVAARDTPASTAPAFGSRPLPWMPAAPPPGDLTDSWFCPGVPAAGEEGTGGEVLIANTGNDPLDVHVTLLAGPGEQVEQTVAVPPFGRVAVDPAASVTTPYAAAIVEIAGGGGIVEQRSVHPAGISVAPCATSTSPNWYLAEGFTAENSTEQLVLSNPYQESAIVDIGFATADGSRQPAQLQGYPVPARSVRIIDLDSIAARDEPQVAVNVVATRGNLVVGRAQLYDGQGRLGYSMTLASPTLRSQWWFANGAHGPDVTERFSIYNPTDEEVEVTPVFLGITGGSDVLVEPIVVPARQLVTYTSDDVANLPAGRHAIVFGTDGVDSIVVERAITRTIEDVPTTSVLLGGLARPDGKVPSTWMMATGPGEPTDDALAVYNTVQADATITVQAVTPDGIVDVPSLAEVPLPAGGLVTISLIEAGIIDTPLLVRATAPVFVERSMPREPTTQGRSASWAIPAAG